MAISDVVGKVFGTAFIAGVEQNTPVLEYLQNRSSEVSGYGDGVDIPILEDLVSVANYTKGSNITYGSLSPEKITLTLDKQKYVAFELEDIDRAQMRVNIWQGAIAESATRFGQQLATDFRALLGAVDYSADSGVRDYVPAADSPTSDAQRKNLADSLHEIVEGYRIAGYTGRPLALLHPQYYRQLVRYVTEDIGYSVGSFQDTGFTQATIGSLFGVDVMPDYGAATPNNLASPSYVFITNRSACYAQQISEVEQMRAPNRFSNRWRALNTYGMLVQDTKSVYRITPTATS